MSRKPRWVGQDLWNLLNLPPKELAEMYGHSIDYIRLARKRKRKDIEKGTTVAPSPEHSEGRLVKTWEVAAFDRVANEWTTTLNHSYEHTNEPLPFDQAQPANITPTDRLPEPREHKLLFVFSDVQIDYRRIDDELVPLHDERALRVAHMICAELQPDEIINLGDTVDLSALSRFDKDSDHFQRTIGPAFQRVHDMYAQFRADTPTAKITEVDSNHNTRLKKHMLKNNDPFYNFKRPGEQDEYPVNSYPYLANLKPLDVNWVSGYGAAEYVYGTEYGKPPIVFVHGQSVASGASTAAKESKLNPENHLVRGHGHRLELHHRTNRAGQYLTSLMVGAMCRIDGVVPGYYSAVDDHNQPVKKIQNWQNSVAVIYDYDGDYQFDNILIRNGEAQYRGKTYKGDSDEQVQR